MDRAKLASVLGRAALAVPVAYHGSWNLGSEGAAWWAHDSGLPVALRFVVGTAELAASVSVMTGIWTRAAALGLVLIFLGAIPQHIANGFSFKKAGIEPLVVYVLLASALVVDSRPFKLFSRDLSKP